VVSSSFPRHVAVRALVAAVEAGQVVDFEKGRTGSCQLIGLILGYIRPPLCALMIIWKLASYLTCQSVVTNLVGP
jgi:hypothetical protein